MNARHVTTIYVDYEVNRRELFRMNLDLAKSRLLIGVLIAAVPIVGLTYIFLLIDEGKILLELSPLLIGAPLLAVGGQVLRLHAACRKFVSQLPESHRRSQYLFQMEMDGFDRTFGESFAHVSWNDVLMAKERPTYFVLQLINLEARLVPKRGFHLPADIPMLRSILRAKLGARAQLF